MGAKKLKPIHFERPLTSTEAMAYIGYKKTKFWELVQSGQIRGRKDGQWRFDIQELDKYKKRTEQS